MCAPRGHLGAPRVHPARSPATQPCGHPAQRPRVPAPCPGGAHAGRPHSRRLGSRPPPVYLRLSPCRCRGRSSRAHPPRAAACRWAAVVGGSVAGPRQGRRLPQVAGRGEEAHAAGWALRPRHGWQGATVCILHLARQVRVMAAATRGGGQERLRAGAPGRALRTQGRRPFVAGVGVGTPILTGVSGKTCALPPTVWEM